MMKNMQNNILEVKNLTKKFGSFTAVNNISFSIKEGEVLGLLGPNGAGKTTTIQILLGITLSTSGSIKYFGKELRNYRQQILQKISFASAFNTLQGRVSVYENLLIFAYLYGLKNPKKRILELTEYFEISSILYQKYWDLSSGQKTRVNLVKSLLNDPKIILMDEPTASLDPDIADKTLSLIETLKKSGNMSMLYTSHNMEEITRICDRVIFLDHGKIAAEDTPLNLTKKISAAQLIITFDGNKKTLMKYLDEQKQNYKFINDYIITIDTEEKSIPSTIFGISKADIWITDIEIKKPTLEDFFLKIARGEIYDKQN